MRRGENLRGASNISDTVSENSETQPFLTAFQCFQVFELLIDSLLPVICSASLPLRSS